MPARSKLLAVIMAAAAVLAAPAFAPAASAAARMDNASRVKAVRGLLQKGVVGENNQGFLEAKGELSPEEAAIFEDENAYRRKAYEEVAKKTGASAADVGRRRAVQNIANAPAGSWVQMDGGTWSRK